MTIIKAHCNECAGERKHELLHTAESSWVSMRYHFRGSDRYELIRCCGCATIKLKHTKIRYILDNDDEEKEESVVSYYPPAIFRREPEWFDDLWQDDQSVDVWIQLQEIYVALQNNLPRLAAMGVRALLEQIMVSKTGDQGSFGKNMTAFEEKGFISKVQRERLEAILEVGHAAIHRAFVPTTDEVVTLIDIAEHIIETVYLHESKVKAVTQRVPPRPERPKKEAAT